MDGFLCPQPTVEHLLLLRLLGLVTAGELEGRDDDPGRDKVVSEVQVGAVDVLGVHDGKKSGRR